MKNQLLLNTIRNKIKKARVISFDVFDTLLLRPYVKPSDVFEHMEKVYEKSGFASERRAAEYRVRIRHPELEDITFDMIYDEIDDEFKDMKKKELAWEEMVLHANPEMKQVYDYAQKQGKKIIIISDMYLPEKFIARILRKNGYDNWDKIYISSTSGKRKITGNLYKLVLDDNNFKPEDILHIGDGKVSDYDQALKLDMNAVLYKQVLAQYVKNNKSAQAYKQKTDSLGASIIQGLLSQHWQETRSSGQETDYWEELGYNYCGPLAYGYARFIEKTAVKNELDHLLFVARDGYILQKVFNTFNTEIKNDYVYAPRIVSMKCIGEYKNLANFTAEAILQEFAEKDDEIKEDIAQLNPLTVPEWQKLFEKHRGKIKEIAQTYLLSYKKYIDAVVKESKNIACIDTSAAYWSAQRLFEKALLKKILGIYFVVYYADGIIARKENFTTFSQNCFPLSKHVRTNTDLFTKNWFFIEFLLSSPEGPINDVLSDGTVKYKETSDDFEVNRSKIYQKITAGALRFAADVNARFKNDVFINYKDIISHINSFIDNPDKEDIVQFQQVNFKWYPTNNDKSIPLFSQSIRIRDYIFHPIETKKHLYSLMWKTAFQKFYLRKIFFYEIKNQSTHVKKFFGMTLYSKKVLPNVTEKKKLFGLIKKKQTINHKKVYFLGIKVRDKRKNISMSDLQNYIQRLKTDIINGVTVRTQRAFTVAFMHQKTFGEFRNKYEGKSLVLVGAGPTVKYFEPIPKAIYVGINRSFLLEKIKFSYLFSIDKHGLDVGEENYWDDFLKYDCIKFIGDQNMGVDYQIPQSMGNGYENVRRYKTTTNYIPANFALDIDTCALKNSASTSIQAMQFILFTNPKKVYVVGIDCTNSSGQHFSGGAYDNSLRNENILSNDKIHVQGWRELKNFITTYYPETEIIVVNPVGLKGIFHDVYTMAYLDKHPEIDREDVGIIDEKEIEK